MYYNLPYKFYYPEMICLFLILIIKYNKFIEYIKYSSNPLIINTIFLILLL